jgi:hypothetical protein
LLRGEPAFEERANVCRSGRRHRQILIKNGLSGKRARALAGFDNGVSLPRRTD